MGGWQRKIDLSCLSGQGPCWPSSLQTEGRQIYNAGGQGQQEGGRTGWGNEESTLLTRPPSAVEGKRLRGAGGLVGGLGAQGPGQCSEQPVGPAHPGSSPRCALGRVTPGGHLNPWASVSSCAKNQTPRSGCKEDAGQPHRAAWGRAHPSTHRAAPSSARRPRARCKYALDNS